MRKSLSAAALVPVTALIGVIPAQAQTATTTVHASAVASTTTPGALPLRAVRSSSTRCSGTLVYKAYAKVGTSVVGELDVYGAKTAGGTVTACFRHAGVTLHHRMLTSVTVAAAKTMKERKPAVQVLAAGNYVSWAGPVAISGVRGHCFQAAGAIKYQGKAVAIAMPEICTK